MQFEYGDFMIVVQQREIQQRSKPGWFSKGCWPAVAEIAAVCSQ
jgi:hypothetical protein